VSLSNSGYNYTCSVAALNAAGTGSSSSSKTLTAVYVNPVYYCNAGDTPGTSSASAFTCTNAAYNNHPYWVSTYYYSSCYDGGWSPAWGNNSNTIAYWDYRNTSWFNSPYDGGSIVNTYRYWGTYSGGPCNGAVNYGRWASTSCYQYSNGTGSVGSCGSTRPYRRIADMTRSLWAYCPSGGTFSGDYCYPHWPNSGYWADNWYWDYTYYTSPLRASGYWNGWTVS
jgi:hypothetical protein